MPGGVMEKERWLKYLRLHNLVTYRPHWQVKSTTFSQDGLLHRGFFVRPSPSHHHRYKSRRSTILQRGWSMTELLSELDSIPPCPVYDRLRSERAYQLIMALPKDHHQVIRNALDSPSDTVNDEGELDVSKQDLLTLAGNNWLNDQVINGYLSLIVAHSRSSGVKVHAFNTFFYSKVSRHGHEAVSRWTKTVDLFSQQLIFIPIHLGAHWTLLVVDLCKHTVLYYDGLSGRGDAHADNVIGYLQAEWRAKEKDGECPLFVGGRGEVPRQRNGFDCGVFVCVYALSVYLHCLGWIDGWPFSQTDMPYFRKRISLDLICNKLTC